MQLKWGFHTAQIELEAKNHSDRVKEMKKLKIEMRLCSDDSRQSNRKKNHINLNYYIASASFLEFYGNIQFLRIHVIPLVKRKDISFILTIFQKNFWNK